MPRELLATASARDLVEMQTYLAKHPPFWVRIEAMIAQLCCLFFNANRGKHTSAARITDFMLFTEKPKARFVKPKDQMAAFRMLAAASKRKGNDS